MDDQPNQSTVRIAGKFSEFADNVARQLFDEMDQVGCPLVAKISNSINELTSDLPATLALWVLEVAAQARLPDLTLKDGVSPFTTPHYERQLGDFARAVIRVHAADLVRDTTAKPQGNA